jgi:hypothetical protein
MDEIDEDIIEEYNNIQESQTTRSGRTTRAPDLLNLFTQGHEVTEYSDSTAIALAKTILTI